MILLRRLPMPVRWITSVLLIFLFIMTFMRIIFFIRYHPPAKAFSMPAMIMGLRFDLKFTCILAAAMLVVCCLPFLNPFKNLKAGKYWNVFLSFLFFSTLLFYAADYYHYDYLQQRLNASVLNYFNDAAITLSMGVESYPVFKVLALMLVLTFTAFLTFKKLLSRYQMQPAAVKKKGIGWYVLFFLLFGFGIFGKIGQFNLRWSDAFTLADNFKANLALNPFQSFFSTLKFRDTKPDIKKVKKYYDLMAGYLNVQKKDSIHLNYERNYPSAGNNAAAPNVIIVICESFSMYRSSMSGNPFNTTPYFNELCKKGVFYDRCFTPSYPTARGVWATITGIPDVLGDNNRSASRDPGVVDQQTIMNDVKGYEKFYFLGGDPTWANIKGLLLNNIDSLHLYSQEDFKAKKLNVWGIDDKNLFLEASKILAGSHHPFFAVIQTADNHRPYTIPEEDAANFKKVDYPKDSVIKYGFDDITQLNAFRYTDYCFQQFIEAAKKENYFSNTIFVFVGDHGLPGNAAAIYPKSWTEQALAGEHVPLLFYSPALLMPRQIRTVCSQTDIMPSVATLLKVPFRNNSMGQSLFDSSIKKPASAFIIDHDGNAAGIVTDEYYYRKNTETGQADFVSVTGNEPVPGNQHTLKVKEELDVLTNAYLETARYLLYNNRKK